MNLHAARSRKLIRRSFIGCAVITAALFVLFLYFRISLPRDAFAYAGMALECHPVWKQFALRRFSAGDSAKEFLLQNPPSRREEFGRYGIYDYSEDSRNGLQFTGFTVRARDGKLISSSAWSCTWDFTFFDIPDPALNQQYTKYLEERSAKREP